MCRVVFIICFNLSFLSLIYSQSTSSLIKVKGEATVFAEPEMMNVNIPITAKALEYEECVNQLLKRYNELSQSMVKAGIPKSKIESSGLSINEDYKYTDRTQILVGYVGNISATLEMNYSTENLQKVVEVLNDERFKFGYNLYFSLSEKQKSDLLDSVLTEAVADAKRKAKILATALGVKIATVEEVNFEYSQNDGGIFRPMYEMEMKSNAGGSQDIALNPKKLEITKTVGVIWNMGE